MNSRFSSEKDRFHLHSDSGQDGEPSGEDSVAGAPDKEADTAATDDMRGGDPPEAGQLGPMSEETQARYAELLLALEQTISQAVVRPDPARAASDSPASDSFEREQATSQPEAPRPNRLPPARSPFAPPKFRSFHPERPTMESAPLEPVPGLFRERPFEYDEVRQNEIIARLKLQTRPHQLAARVPESRARQQAGRGLLRRVGLTGVVTGAVILLGGLYLSDTGHAPKAASASATPSLLQRVFNGAGDRPPAAPAARRMVVTDLSGSKNRPIALGVTVEAPPSGASVVVKGMPSGSRLTAGAAIGQGTWRIPMRDMARAAVVPPTDYVGTMHLAVDLRLADDTVADSDVVRLEWTATVAEGMVPKPVRTMVIAGAGNPFPPAPSAVAAAPPPPAPPTPAPPAAAPPAATDASGAKTALAAVRPNATPVEQPKARPAPEPVVRQLDRDELATLLERGEGYLQDGDIAAARVVLRRAADAGHAQAAMALAATYDPVALKEAGTLGVAADIATARVWYEKASQLGSAEAIRRLQRLAQQQSQ
jgi:hypothetical protein